MITVIILGAGGHAQVVADILMRAHEAGGDCKPIAYLDDDQALIGTVILGLSVVGTIGQLGQFDHDAVIVAIGDNRPRSRVFESVRARGEQVIDVIHPAAVLAPDVRLGEGVMVGAGVVVNTGSVIGENVILNTGCIIDHHNYIGAHAHIAPGARLSGGVVIGNGTLVGTGASIIPYRKVGQWSIVGAGAAVVDDIPDGVTAVGVPARVIKGRPTT